MMEWLLIISQTGALADVTGTILRHKQFIATAEAVLTHVFKHCFAALKFFGPLLYATNHKTLDYTTTPVTNQ